MMHGLLVITAILCAALLICQVPACAEPVPAARAAGPLMDDAAFFAVLDLERPDLTQVKAAAERSDWSAAKRAFVAHLKSRAHPKWLFNWQDRASIPAEATPAELLDADRYARNELVSLAVWHDFGRHIDWNANPTPNQYNEWTWSLNRHAFWETLGKAYWTSGDEKYARAFVGQMTDWIRSQPCPGDSGNRPYSSWRTIETGIRMYSSWPNAFFYFLSSSSFDDESIVLMVKSFADHADHLMKHPQTVNWLLLESNGLYHAGVLFPELKAATVWRETALDRLQVELDKQVYSDGAQFELTSSYHNISLNCFMMPVELARLNGYPIPEGYVAKLQRMFEYDLYISMPDRRMPPMNDSEQDPIEPWMQKAAVYFPDRTDFLWMATGGREGLPPPTTSHAFPYAGYYVMRSGWDSDARYMLLDAGPFGAGGHQHEDKLTIVAGAYGRMHIVDFGIYAYDTSVWRRYCVDTFAHNTVLVDGQPQRRRGSKDRSSHVVPEPQPHTFFLSDAVEYVSGVYDEGYGEDKRRIAEHRREIIYVKSASDTSAPGEYWIILDTLTPSDTAPHTYDAMFHLNADGIQLRDDLTVITTNQTGSNLAIVPLPDEALSVTNQAGQKEPFIQGWAREGMYEVRPIPTPVYHKQATGATTTMFVIYPLRAGESLPITAVTQADVDAEQPFVFDISFGEHGIDRVSINSALPKPVSIETRSKLTRER